MATQINDNQQLQNQINDLGQQVDHLNGLLSKNFPTNEAIKLSDIPQGPGSRLDSDTVDGYQVTPASQPGKNSLVTTGNNGKLPASVIPAPTIPTSNVVFSKLNSDITTSSNTYVSTTLSTTITTTGTRVILTVSGTFQSDTSNGVFFRINRDSGTEYQTLGEFSTPGTTPQVGFSATHLFTGLTAGSHTFLLEWKVSANSVTSNTSSTPDVYAMRMVVNEI